MEDQRDCYERTHPGKEGSHKLCPVLEPSLVIVEDGKVTSMSALKLLL